MIPNALSVTFLFYALLVVGLVALWLQRTLPADDAKQAVMCLFAWLAFVAVPASTGYLERGGDRQPRFLLVIVPMVVFVIWLSVRPAVGVWARTLRVELLMGAQVFRVGVEALLYFLWQANLVPRVMTFEGRNVDILIGLSAPLAGWAYHRYPAHRHMLCVGWNVAGLLCLANVVGHGMLSAPGPARILINDVPNRAVILFPYIYLPAVFVLLAVSLHILALRACSREHR